MRCLSSTGDSCLGARGNLGDRCPGACSICASGASVSAKAGCWPVFVEVLSTDTVAGFDAVAGFAVAVFAVDAFDAVAVFAVDAFDAVAVFAVDAFDAVAATPAWWTFGVTVDNSATAPVAFAVTTFAIRDLLVGVTTGVVNAEFDRLIAGVVSVELVGENILTRWSWFWSAIWASSCWQRFLRLFFSALFAACR